MKNPRFGFIIISIPIVNIWSFIALIKKFKNPEKIFLYNDRICKDNITIKKQNIIWIKKVFTSFWAKKPEELLEQILFPIIFAIAVCFLILSNLLAFIMKLFVFLINRNLKFSLFCSIIFYDDNNAINIYLINHIEYEKLNSYLLQNFNLQIKDLDKNYKFYK